ncbi:uncharacterized protein [Ptychodera flava]|uniref:uncharacterized protein isoform X2 n=1 Tax=Ptychodera flava TaxID=63121 RepID=UPI00396A55D7
MAANPSCEKLEMADWGMEVDTVRPGYDARPTTINIHGGHVQMGLVNQMKEVLRKYGPPPAGPPNIDLHIVRSESYRMERVEEDIGSREEKIRKLVDMGFPEENVMRVVRGFPKLRIEELINRLVKMQSSKTDGHTLRQPQKPQKPDKPGIMRGQGDGSEEGEEIVPGMKYQDDYPISPTVESPESKHRVGFDVDQPCKGPVASGARKIPPRYHGKDDLHGEMKIGEKDKTTITSRGIADKTTLNEDHAEDTDGRMRGSSSDSHSSEPRPLGAPGVELDHLKAPPCKLSSENLLKVTETSPSPSMTSEDSAVGSSLKSDDLRSDFTENIEKVASSRRDTDVKICREHLQRGPEDDRISCEVEPPLVDTESGAYLLSSEQIEVVTNKRATLISNDGAFGPVYKGIFPYRGPHKGEKVAVKVLDKSGDHGSSEYNREKTVATVKHPNILPVFAVCEEDGCIVYPYMENRDLSYQLKAKNQELTWQKRLVIAIGIGKAISCLHTPTELRPSKIFHRDIKSANILLDDKWWPYLGDTGLTREIPKEKMYKSRTGFQTFLCGTLGYSDPSLVNKPPGYYDAASDVYSYGKVLLELLTGVLASETADDDSGDFVHNQWEDEGFFEDVTGRDLVKKADTSRHVAWPETVKEEFAKIIVSCLKRNRKKRQKLDVICKKLEELRMEHRVTLFCSTSSEKCCMCLTSPLSDKSLACGCRTVCSNCIDNRRRNYLACPEHGNVQPSDD